MTARDVYDAVGIELNKVKAPSILLEDFNYFFNKSIAQAANKFYNTYDVSQQTTDDIRVLKASSELTPIKFKETTGLDLYGASYEVFLPPDYFHVLNVVCKFIPIKNYKCYKANTPVYFGARRLVADSWPVIISNLYNRPSYKMPYYFLHNVNTSNTLSTNPYIPYNASTNPNPLGKGTDFNGTYTVDETTDIRNLTSEITINGNTVKLANSQKEAAYRYGNASSVRMEIRYGKDASIFTLDKVYVDYLKSPQFVVLSEEQIDSTLDSSQIMEFPDYVIYEIINTMVGLIMENTSNPRLQTNIPISQTIAPAQQQVEMQQVKEQIRNM